MRTRKEARGGWAQVHERRAEPRPLQAAAVGLRRRLERLERELVLVSIILAVGLARHLAEVYREIH